MATSNTEEIRIQVDQETAKAYKDSPEEERRAVSTLLRLWLKGGKPSPESLKRAMDEIGQRARNRGLTAEILEDAEIEALYQALRDTLQQSIDLGGSAWEMDLYGFKGRWDTSYFSVAYREGQPCVPLRLTAIATVPDMPITAYFLADAVEAAIEAAATSISLLDLVPGNADADTGDRAAIVLDGPGDVGAERTAFDTLCQFSAVDPFIGAPPEAARDRYAAISPATQSSISG